MKIEDIQSILKSSNLATTNKLISLVLKLYSENRVVNTNLENDGDTLLFQWGTYTSDNKDFFEIDLTRQVIPDLDDIDEATDNMQQLKTTLKFLTTEITKSFLNGNHWCSLPSELSDFEELISSNNAYMWACENTPFCVEIELNSI